MQELLERMCAANKAIFYFGKVIEAFDEKIYEGET